MENIVGHCGKCGAPYLVIIARITAVALLIIGLEQFNYLWR